jgi:hypothetical protein
MLGLHAVTERLPRHHPAPFSAHIGMPPLSRGRSFLSRMFPALTNPRFALFGRNPIISSPAPLSSLFGMKTLKERSAPWEKSFGWPLLMKKGRPTSLGLPLLSRNPAPLSSLFGLRVLSIFQ